MFDFFTNSSKRKELQAQIVHRRRLMENAMKRHGVNSPQAVEFDKQLDQLERELMAA